MTDIAIKVENLGKRYRLGVKANKQETLGGTFASWAKSPLSNYRRLRSLSHFSNDETGDDVLWALQDVSFEVKQGEVLGIIGWNGAGKSTLLKILSHITPPTTGQITLNGRVASLLEVGTGFHPELTGRENVYLNGAILGMNKTEIDRKFDEIVDFSGIEKFIDTPVKRYSSGMNVRLAFSVAAHLEPEILLIDEVLAVGDIAFQKKSLGKMDEVAQGGRTVLFVSHNMGAVKRLCPQTIYMRHGRLQNIGATQKIIAEYISQGLDIRSSVVWDANDLHVGDEFLKLQRLDLKNQAEEATIEFDFLEPIILDITYQVLQSSRIRLLFWLYNNEGLRLFISGNTEAVDHIPQRQIGQYVSRAIIPSHLLNNGQYFITILADIPGERLIVKQENILSFQIHATDGIPARRDDVYGVICPPIQWETNLQSSVNYE